MYLLLIQLVHTLIITALEMVYSNGANLTYPTIIFTVVVLVVSLATYKLF